MLPGGNAHWQQQHDTDEELLGWLDDPGELLDGLELLGFELLGELLGDELLEDPQHGQFG